MSRSEENSELRELIEMTMDGSIDQEQAKQLSEILAGDPAARNYYCKYMELSIGLDIFTTGISPVDFLDLVDFDTAETGSLAVSGGRSGYIFNRKKIFSIASAAAILIFGFFLADFFYKSHNSVAIVAESMNSVWSGVSGYTKPGKYLKVSGKQFNLLAGYVRLDFDNGADVLIEAPADFSIASDNKIWLRRGKVYSVVPPAASGFTISTDNADIIDIGTEFGVRVERSEDTDLHVIKGKTNLVIENGTEMVASEVSAGMARNISGEGYVSEIECQADLFARNINPETGMVWRGQSYISLADIVGGGNGFGEGRDEYGYNPANGILADMRLRICLAKNDYRPVDNLYIDGVFVPSGESRQVVSSEGDVFTECPVTSGLSFNNIVNTVRDVDIPIGNKVVDKVSRRCMIMHTNSGITFDLKVIRNLVPGSVITTFESQFGIEKTTIRPKLCNADFWVLVDGRVRYSKLNVKDLELDSLSIELSEQDRFLTLVTTDGGDPDHRRYNGMLLSPIDSDWCMFVEPILKFKPVK